MLITARVTRAVYYAGCAIMCLTLLMLLVRRGGNMGWRTVDITAVAAVASIGVGLTSFGCWKNCFYHRPGVNKNKYLRMAGQ
jgi:hypothetical protein